MKPQFFRFLHAGEGGLVVEFGEEIDPRTNFLVLELEKKIRGEGLPGIEETVPTYRSLFISFDPMKFSHHQLKEKLQGMIATLEIDNGKEGRLVQIPVVYGGEFGPDLQGVAEMKGLAQEEVIRLHTSREFRVFMIGFTPGFPYLGVLPPEIAVPRLETPRLRVPKGSVGIAEHQTGIYPLESPGGWRIIGRTPLQLFNPETNPPFLLSPGDRVRFFPISPKEYQELLQDGSL